MKPFPNWSRQSTRVLQQILKIDEKLLSRLQSINACLQSARVNLS